MRGGDPAKVRLIRHQLKSRGRKQYQETSLEIVNSTEEIEKIERLGAKTHGQEVWVESQRTTGRRVLWLLSLRNATLARYSRATELPDIAVCPGHKIDIM